MNVRDPLEISVLIPPQGLTEQSKVTWTIQKQGEWDRNTNQYPWNDVASTERSYDSSNTRRYRGGHFYNMC